MEKKGYLRNMLVFAAVAIIGLGFTSCKDDEDAPGTSGGTGSGLVGWYTDLSTVAKQSDFNEINKAINNHELLKSYGGHGTPLKEYYATRDLFIWDGGYFSTSDNNCGRLRFSIDGWNNFVRVVDNSTIQRFTGNLCLEGASYGEGKILAYKLYAGPIFGNMAYYGTGTYYTYVKQGNKIIVTNGDIYTIVDGGLIKDGTSEKLSKYDPSKRY